MQEETIDPRELNPLALAFVGDSVLELLVRMSREQKKTVVMVTHNSSFAEIADKVIRVKNGGIESVTINEHPKRASEVSW